MSLANILLGMLSEPASGYDLKRQFNQSLAHFWAAELAQIYPTLRRLEHEGKLEVSLEPSAQGPERKVYRRTADGARAVREWLREGPVLNKDRISYLAQVFFLHELDDEADACEFLTELRASIAARLEALKSIEAGWRADDPRYPDGLPDCDFYPQLTLRLGLVRLAATLEWCDESLERIGRRSGAQRSGAAGKSSSVS